MNRKSQSDEELWMNILDGDDQSFAIFYDRYWLRMYKAAQYYLRDPDASEEVVQEVFLLIWNKRHHLQIKNFAAYLNSATRYEVYRKLRAAKNSLLEFHEDYNFASSVVYNQGYDRLNEIDKHNQLQRCLNALPERCREIFYLSKFRHLSNTEIAEKLGISKHSVENQLSTALKHLRINFTSVAMLVYLLFNNHH